MVRSEMLATRPRLTTSATSSCGVQWVTGRSDRLGGSHETAMIVTRCSGVNVSGAPGRGASANTVSSSANNCRRVAPSSRAVSSCAWAAAQRSRHSRTVPRSRPSRRAIRLFERPLAACKTIRMRQTRQRGNCWRRSKRLSSFRTRLVKCTTEAGCGPGIGSYLQRRSCSRSYPHWRFSANW